MGGGVAGSWGYAGMLWNVYNYVYQACKFKDIKLNKGNRYKQRQRHRHRDAQVETNLDRQSHSQRERGGGLTGEHKKTGDNTHKNVDRR